jgi:hypothetical protein
MIDRGSERRIVDTLYPEYDDPKEPYAFFGLAAFWAQCFEQSLILLITASKILHRTKTKEKTVDEIFVNLDKKTLGNLIRELSEFVNFEVDRGSLTALLSKRNYLMHHFWSENSDKCMADVSRRGVIDELRDLAQAFQDGDRELVNIYEPLWTKLGISEEIVQRELDRLRAGIQ